MEPKTETLNTKIRNRIPKWSSLIIITIIIITIQSTVAAITGSPLSYSFNGECICERRYRRLHPSRV